jgi:hypothetical protein
MSSPTPGRTGFCHENSSLGGKRPLRRADPGGQPDGIGIVPGAAKLSAFPSCPQLKLVRGDAARKRA